MIHLLRRCNMPKQHLSLSFTFLTAVMIMAFGISLLAPMVRVSAAPISSETASKVPSITFLNCFRAGLASVYNDTTGLASTEPYNPTLEQGSKDKCVSSLQYNLDAFGKTCSEAAIPQIQVSGVYGANTAIAVKDFQRNIAKYFLVNNEPALVTGIMADRAWAIMHADTCPVASTALSVHINDGQLLNGTGLPLHLVGVDVSGTEDACINGDGFSWIPSNISDSTEAAAIASWHINAVRIPLNEDCWLGINGAPAAYSGQNYQTYIKNWVAALNHDGIYAILDLHMSAPGSYESNRQWPMPDSDHSPTFWSQVASTFAANQAVVFDLFNEPYMGIEHPDVGDWSCWRNGCTGAASINGATVSYKTAGMQQLVNAIRNTGATQPIMISGLNWAGDPCGLKDSDASSSATCMIAAYKPIDPLNQLAVSFHSYNWSACSKQTCWTSTATALAAAGLPIITGELGEDNCSDSYMTAYTNWADKNNVSYLAWSWVPNPASATSCIADANGDGMNFDLLANWSGAPSSIIPQGEYYKAHLAALAKT